jgi:hypothetical protein
MIESMLTTIDNPHDPFDDYDTWYAFDVRHGYHTASFLSRILVSSDELSEADQDLAMEQAIDEIIKENVSGIYKKVTREVPETKYLL